MHEDSDLASRGALRGIRVLEFSQVVAGPTCGRALSQLGADVIKVEPPEGDPYRNTGTVVPNEGKRFQSLNLGKRSIVVDLSNPDGQALVQRLAQTVDVVVINYRHGVAARLGIDAETLMALNPRLIYCRLTGFGVQNRSATAPATDPMMAAYSGLMVGGGKVDESGMPQPLGAAAIADAVTGYVSAMAVCAALYARIETGRGQVIDASLLRSALSVQETTVMREPTYDATQRDPMVAEIERLRLSGGSYVDMLAAREQARSTTTTLRFYSGAYRAKDGVVMLGALTPNSRAAARAALGVEDDPTLDVPDDPRAPEYQARLQALKDHIASTIAGMTVKECISRLEPAGCPVAPVNFPETMSDDEVVREEGIMWEVVNYTTGPQRVVGPIVTMSDTPTAIKSASPPLGAHTVEVLSEAGLTSEEIDGLVARSVVRTGPS
jgi:formyl-CoA transferase